MRMRRVGRRPSVAGILASLVIPALFRMLSGMSGGAVLVLGFVLAGFCYFLAPGLLEQLAAANAGNPELAKSLGSAGTIARWIGMACGLIGIYVGARKLIFKSAPVGFERQIVSRLAKLMGKRL